MSEVVPIKRALISVSDKTGIIDLARELHAKHIEIFSTGGTAQLLRKHVPIIDVSEYTGFPEMMDGRVKTLHPKIHGGLLGRRDKDAEAMKAHGILPIDLLIVNLYPFQQTVSRLDCNLVTAIENIDIGGPTLLRAAAKNYTDVTVVVDTADYPLLLAEMHQQNGGVNLPTRFALAKKAFAHTAQYDATIANYLGQCTLNGDKQAFPDTFSVQWSKKQDLRYGENPHQKAAFYAEPHFTGAAIATAQQLQGKALSFNNIVDADTALECIKSFSEPACVIVKHANPCGVALAKNLLAAYEQAFATDPTSAFGGIIAFNKRLDAKTLTHILEKQFVEVIIAPEIEQAALAAGATKPNVRLLQCGHFAKTPSPSTDFKRVAGGVLIQDCDSVMIDKKNLKVVSDRPPTSQELNDLLFAWKVAKFVKSNAIVYAKNNVTTGIGAGQMSRIYSARIAALKAADEGLTLAGSVMASDAFFPFRDSVDAAVQAGITAIIQPGGSIRDEEVIQAANDAGITLVFTGIRHFRH